MKWPETVGFKIVHWKVLAVATFKVVGSSHFTSYNDKKKWTIPLKEENVQTRGSWRVGALY